MKVSRTGVFETGVERDVVTDLVVATTAIGSSGWIEDVIVIQFHGCRGQVGIGTNAHNRGQ